MANAKEAPRYEQILGWVFDQRYRPGDRRVDWVREDLDSGAEALLLKRVKNLGDIPYTYRFRKDMPDVINATAPEGMEWIIRGLEMASTGSTRSLRRFRLCRIPR